MNTITFDYILDTVKDDLISECIWKQKKTYFCSSVQLVIMKWIKINYICKMLAFIFQNVTYHNISV